MEAVPESYQARLRLRRGRPIIGGEHAGGDAISNTCDLKKRNFIRRIYFGHNYETMGVYSRFPEDRNFAEDCDDDKFSNERC